MGGRGVRGWEAEEGALTQYLMEEKEGGKRGGGWRMVEMERRADMIEIARRRIRELK